METKKTKDGYVDITLPFDPKYLKDPMNVIVNGVKYSVPRGRKVSVPTVVAEIIEQSQAQDAYAAAVDEAAKKVQEIVM